MSWFLIEDPSTGKVVSPFERLPPGPLRFSVRSGWALRVEDGAEVTPAPGGAATDAWLVAPTGPFSLVVEHPGGARFPLRFDDVPVAPPWSARTPVPPADDARPPAPAPAPAPGPVTPSPVDAAAPESWCPRTLAVELFTAPARTSALIDLARRAEDAGRRVREIRARCDELPVGDRDELALVLGLVHAATSEAGGVPAWVADPRAARAQREVYRATLGRAGASVGASAAPPVGAPRGDVLEALLGWLPPATAPCDGDVEARLAAVVAEMERIDAALGALADGVRCMAADGSHRRDVREAMEARAAIRALGAA
ncbi:MAG: hypothetical protein Q8S73_20410 [Deltaproteobacteria bacterium]|nr:hypothetical protein [Myxococcales bacterium]MDP3216483.1 hypothetical protein [Deltaproteobacteria bacterium]